MGLTSPFRLAYAVVRRFQSESYAQTAAALSFATLLGLVPMLAVAAALMSFFPFGAGLEAALQKFLLSNLLPEKAGGVIAKYVGTFANRVNRVTFAGVSLLAITALIQMFTIERAFNAIWRVKQRRSVTRRAAVHATAMLLGPVVFGASLAGTTFLVTTSLGWLDEPAWVTVLINKSISFVLVSVMFALLYRVVPNREVVWRHAIWGGLAAAGGFSLLQYLFSSYVVKLSSYTVLFGTFSAIPIFLSWIYASWGVILAAAILVAELPRLAPRN
jgi:membrane protein